MVVLKRKSKGKTRGNKSKKANMDDESYYGSGLSDGAIKRLARRGGILRIGHTAYPEIRSIYLKFLETLVGHSVAYCELSRRKTIFPIDVIYSLKAQGRNLYGYLFDDKVGGHNAIVHEEDKKE